MKTPGETIRSYCVQCNGGLYNEVALCKSMTCQFFRYRLGRGRPSVKIIKKFCIHDCMNGYKDLVRTCTVEDCLCYPYRFGTSPNRREITDEHKAKLLAGLSKGREIKRSRSQQPVEIKRTRTRKVEVAEQPVIRRTRGGK